MAKTKGIMMSELTDLLDKIGMNQTELSVYETIVAFGFHTAGQITQKTQLNYSDVKQAAESLIEKNYLKKKELSSIEGTIYFPLAPKIAISSNLSKNLSERLTSLSTKVSELWNKTQGHIDNNTGQLIEKIHNSFVEYAGKVEALGTSSRTSFEEWSSESLENFTSQTKGAISEFKTTVIDPLATLSEKLDSLSDSVKSKAAESTSEINNKTALHKESIENAVGAIKNELEEFVDEVGFVFSGRVSGLNQIIENLSGTASENADKLISNYQEQFSESFSSGAKVYDSMDESLIQTASSEYQSATLKVLDSNTKFSKSFTETIDSVESKIKSIKDLTISASQQIINELFISQKENVSGLQEQFKVAVHVIQDNALQQLNTIMTDTAETLKDIHSNIEQNLTDFQTDLGTNLNDLSTNVGNSLDTRFTEIEDLLGQFVENLRSSIKDNVSETSQSIISTNEFLQTFLQEVKDKFETQIDGLQQDIRNDLADIVSSASDEIDGSIAKNDENLETIEADVNIHLEEFQSSISTFLQAAKTDLKTNIDETRATFSNQVQEGIADYQSESQNIIKDQEHQIELFKDEVSDLEIESNRAKDGLLTFANEQLSSTKEAKLMELSETIDQRIETTSSKINQFSDKLQSDMKSFSSSFHDETSKLRNDVPQSIETLMVDQIDRLENFRRQFEGNRGKIIDFFAEITQKLQPGERIWRDKNFQSEFYENATRLKSDFQRFVNQIQEHFKITTEDAEDTKNEVLAEFNKSIQDEIVRLDDIIMGQERTVRKLGEEFASTFNEDQEVISSEINSGIDAIFEEIKVSIAENIKTKFEEPLQNILSKSMEIATGSKEGEGKSPMAISQDQLIEQLNSTVQSFFTGLEDSFSNTISSLDTKVQQSVDESSSIVTNLKNDLASTFSKQKETSTKFNQGLKQQIKQVEEKVNQNLAQSLNSSRQSLTDTFANKSTEVQDTVTEKTTEINSATNEKLTEIQGKLDEFKKNLRDVQSSATETVNTTVSQSLESQKTLVYETLQSLGLQTYGGQETIFKTQTSLEDTVVNTLTKVSGDVDTLVSDYDNAVSTSQSGLEEKITEQYQISGKLSELEVIKSQMENAIDEYLSQVKSAQEGLLTNLTSELNSLKSQKLSYHDDQTKKLSELLNSLASSNSDFILDLFDQVSTQLSSVQAEVLGSIENTKSNVEITVTNAVETVRTDILQPSNEVVNAINESTSVLTNQISSISQEFKEMKDKEDTVIDAAQSQLGAKMKESLTTEVNTLKTNSEALFIGHAQELTTLSKDFESDINSATMQGKEAVSEELSKIPNIIEETLDVSAQSMALLNEISKGAIELDPTIPDTSYFDASPEAIRTNLNGLLSRTKSNITIVSPTISWLNPELIPEFKRATVRIVIDPDKLTMEDHDLIKQFQENDVNVALRQVDKNRYRRDLNMIVASRDKEEIMLSKLLTTDQPYAFVSQDEYFIELFTEVIAPFGTMPEYKPS